MKRSVFIKKVLKNKFNTVFTDLAQVQNALDVFEALGMLPPTITKETLTQEVKNVAIYNRSITFGPTYSLQQVNEWEPED